MTQNVNQTQTRLPPDISGVVIDELGGTSAVSRVCEVTTAAVAQWRKKGIPRYRFLFLREKYRTFPVMRRPEIKSI